MPVIINGSTGISGNDGTASTPTIQGTDTNTGIYFPGADRIGFAEGGVQVGEFDASGNFLFNSGYGSTAVAFGCRAWVNFNGTGTVAIRASGNVSSITDRGVGQYTVNLSTAMPDANYSVLFDCSDDAVSNRAMNLQGTTLSASSTQINIFQISPSAQVDSTIVFYAAFR